MMYYYNQPFGIISMLFFWGVIVFVIIAILRFVIREGQPQHRSNALSILRERYAKGEINKQEFEEKKKDLS